MQKILTAMGNEELNNKLKNIKEFKVYEKDIQYKEGIIEVLKKEKFFDILIIYEKLNGEIDLRNLIKKIKIINSKINIFFILDEKNENLEKILFEENIKNIFYNNEINLKNFIKIIKQLNFSEEEILKKEIQFLKNKLEKNEKNKNNYSEKIIFLIKSNLDEIQEYKGILDLLKNKNLINSEKINIIFLENKNAINYKILKNVFKKYNILGKIKIKKNKILIDKKIKELEIWN